MYTLVLGSNGIDSTGFHMLMEKLHVLWPKGRHVAIIPEKPCPWVGTASSLPSGNTPVVEHSKTFQKEKGWKDVYVAQCTPVDAMFYGVNHSKLLLGFDNPFDVVISGIHHGEITGLDVLLSSACIATTLGARTYGIRGLCLAQQMSKPRQGDIDRKNFAVSERLLGNVLTSMLPQPGECLVLNVPDQASKGPRNTIIADYQPRIPAKISPYLSGPKTDVSALAEGYVTVSEFMLGFNSGVRL